jgi:hypothetical protein
VSCRNLDRVMGGGIGRKGESCSPVLILAIDIPDRMISEDRTSGMAATTENNSDQKSIRLHHIKLSMH